MSGEWREWTVSRLMRTGHVRTIVVSFHPRHKRDSGKPYISKKPQSMELAVQRFAVLLPMEEQEAGLDPPHDAESDDPVLSAMTENYDSVTSII